MNFYSRSVLDILAILLGALLLSLVGFINGFPLVYADSGTYILCGNELFVPADRPVTYSLFLFLTGIKYSPWFSVIFQNLLSSITVFLVYRNFICYPKARFFFFLATILVLVCTGFPWYSNQLMPDIFTPLSCLLFFVLISSNHRHAAFKIAVSILLWLCSIMHLSNVLIVSALFIAWWIIQILKHRRYGINRTVLICVLTIWISIPTIHKLMDNEFTFSKSSHVFFMSHLADTGVLQYYLANNCNESENGKLCGDLGLIPDNLNDFIWKYSKLGSSGSAKEVKDEYNAVILDILTTPKYMLRVVSASIQYSFSQFFMFSIGDGLYAYGEGTPPHAQISKWYPEQLSNFNQNLQNRNSINFQWLSGIQLVLVLCAVVFYFIALVLKFNLNQNKFLLFVLLSLLFNASLTAGLNAPVDRFQCRIVWIILLPALIYFSKLIINKYDLKR